MSKSKENEPPFTLSSEILNLVAQISECIGELSALTGKSIVNDLHLRRINRIRTIQGTLAIEGNTLSQKQITAILAGKRVLAPPHEVQEVQNALKIYEQLDLFAPYKEKDLFKAHRVLMKDLIKQAGRYRVGGAGVMKGQKLIHMAPSASMVPGLMKALFAWLKQTKHHPLIASSIFHYEFELIHPFEDGNGRIGRLWQTLTLSKWNALFAFVPVENLVFKMQKEYYNAINQSSRAGDSAVFVVFILERIYEALLELLNADKKDTPEDTPEVTPEVKKLLKALKSEMSRARLMQKLKLKDEKHFREKYLAMGLKLKLIERTIPAKPNSRLQRYRLTEGGREFLGKAGYRQ